MKFDERYEAWEGALAAGDKVVARWTNSYRLWHVPATIKRVNRASIRVTLDVEVTERLTNGPHVVYPKGREIVVPTMGARGWSPNNCLLPPVLPNVDSVDYIDASVQAEERKNKAQVMTRTFATLEVSKQTYEEIAEKLRAAGYDHVFLPSRDTIGIDMNGICLQVTREALTEKK